MQDTPKPCYIKDFGKYETVSLSAYKSTLNICAVLKNNGGPKTAILLRNTLAAKVYLGCIVDSSNQIYDWIEIWVQDTQPTSYADYSPNDISNAMLDRDWARNFEQLKKLPNFGLINTGWEEAYPQPVFLDCQTNTQAAMKDNQTGESWQLCTDDVLLQNNHLSLYNTSNHRYLYLPSLTQNPRFIAVYDFSPKNDSMVLLKDFLKDHPHLLPFNPAGGFMLVRKFYPLDIESLIEILSSSTASQISAKLPTGDLVTPLKTYSIESHTSCGFHRLFCDTRNAFSRVAETFYLKLQFFTEMVSAVYGLIKSSQKPLFNLCPASWQADLIPNHSYLPALWTARPVLVDPGTAVYLNIPGTDKGYFASVSNSTDLSIYRPASVSLKTGGFASILIRQLHSETNSSLSLDGTFFSNERLLPATNDLVRLRLNLTSDQMDFYAVLEKDASLPPGQWRFRTLGQVCNELQKSLLQSAVGVHLSNVPFQVIPCLSTPCDLYSLAILGIRIFIVNDTNSLPIALDELLSLARSISHESESAVPLYKSIERIFNADSRWINVLGSRHLTAETISSDPAANMLPATLWYELLAVFILMIPGAVHASLCKNYGDAPAGGLHLIFEKPLEQLEYLLTRTRCLLFHDWRANQQIYKVIDEFNV